MIDRKWLYVFVGDNHMGTFAGEAEQLTGKGIGQPDTAVGGWIVGHRIRAVKGDAGPGKTLHERHRRVGIDV